LLATPHIVEKLVQIHLMVNFAQYYVTKILAVGVFAVYLPVQWYFEPV
jgi:hypothetical protein